MRATFRDAGLQRRFAADGYVRVRLLPTARAEELRAAWERLRPGLEAGFHPSLLSDDLDYRRAAAEDVRAAFEEPLSELLDGHRLFSGGFAIKVPGPESEVPLHQDWTFVDEAAFSGLTVWCALMDTTAANGTLRVVPGSHRWCDTPRGSPDGTWPVPWAPYAEILRESGSVEVPLEPGEALVYDNRVLHWSPPNTASEARVVAAAAAVPAEAPIRHLFMNADGTAEVYRTDDPEFFFSFVPGQRPTGVECIERFTPAAPELDLADLDPGLVPAPPPPPTPDPPRRLRRIGWMLPHPARHVARLVWDRAHRRRTEAA